MGPFVVGTCEMGAVGIVQVDLRNTIFKYSDIRKQEFTFSKKKKKKNTEINFKLVTFFKSLCIWAVFERKLQINRTIIFSWDFNTIALLLAQNLSLAREKSRVGCFTQDNAWLRLEFKSFKVSQTQIKTVFGYQVIVAFRNYTLLWLTSQQLK